MAAVVTLVAVLSMAYFLPERDYVTFECMPSQIRLSSSVVVCRLFVCNVRAPNSVS